MSKKTNYTIRKCGNNTSVWKGEKREAHGFGDDESALHAIWVIEEKNQNDFYVVHDGEVSRVERDTL